MAVELAGALSSPVTAGCAAAAAAVCMNLSIWSRSLRLCVVSSSVVNWASQLWRSCSRWRCCCCCCSLSPHEYEKSLPEAPRSLEESCLESWGEYWAKYRDEFWDELPNEGSAADSTSGSLEVCGVNVSARKPARSRAVTSRDRSWRRDNCIASSEVRTTTCTSP